MRFIITLVLGLASGALMALAVLLLNPAFDGAPADDSKRSTLALTVAGQGAVTVMESATGYPWIADQPSLAQTPKIAGTRSHVAVMLSSTRDADTVAYVAKISSLSQQGRPLFGEIIERTLWHVVVPAKGSFIVTADDDLWGFARELAVPLLRGETWRGRLAFDTTTGPQRGYGQAIGISGAYAGLTGSASLTQVLREVSLGAGVTDASATLSINF